MFLRAYSKSVFWFSATEQIIYSLNQHKLLHLMNEVTYAIYKSTIINNGQLYLLFN